jgi:hypothetical protein
LRVSTINGVETSIGEVGVNGCEVEYDKDSKIVNCSSIADGASVAVYNLGGVLVDNTVASGNAAAVSLVGQPQGSYIIVIRGEGGVRTHKFIKW